MSHTVIMTYYDVIFRHKTVDVMSSWPLHSPILLPTSTTNLSPTPTVPVLITSDSAVLPTTTTTTMVMVMAMVTVMTVNQFLRNLNAVELIHKDSNSSAVMALERVAAIKHTILINTIAVMVVSLLKSGLAPQIYDS